MSQDADKIAAMRQRIADAKKAEDELLGHGDDNEDQDSPDEIPLKFIAECFRQNERGDGMLFARLHRGKFIYVKSMGQWLKWTGHHWQLDNQDISHDAVNEVALKFEDYIVHLKIRQDELTAADRNFEAKKLENVISAYKSRAKKLRSLKGAKACLEQAHKIGDMSLSIYGDELDKKPHLLACKNCVVNLLTGEVVDALPEDYLLHAIDCEWRGINEPAPTWDKFFDEIHQSDPGLKQLVQTILGYSITGFRTEHFIACFIGDGRNGKGTMFEGIRQIMGKLAWNISPEMIMEQKYVKSSAGPSPDLYSLKGKRIAIASETDENHRISGAAVKRLTGGDTIITRAPHATHEINFRPTHKLILYTNHIPEGLAKDYALFKRLLLINYPLRYVDNPIHANERQRDPDLPDKLEAEASGILAWLVRGSLMWRAGGIKPPPSVLAKIEELRKAEDTVLSFFTDRLQKAPAGINGEVAELKFSQIYEAFKTWYADSISESTKYMPSKKRVSKWLADAEFKIEKIGGTSKVFGIEFKNLGEFPG